MDLPVPREPSRKQGFISSSAPIFKLSGGAKVWARRSGRSSKYSARTRRNGLLESTWNASETTDDAVLSGRIALHMASTNCWNELETLVSNLP